MMSWLQRVSIRMQIFLFALAIMLPVAAMLAWFLGAEVRHARETAHQRVKSVAAITAVRLELMLHEYAEVMGRIGRTRPDGTLDVQRIGTLANELLAIHPEFNNLGARDREANNLYSYLANPSPTREAREFPWFRQGIRSEKFTVGDAFYGRLTARWVSVLTAPLRDQAGAVSGLINLSLDLHKLNERLFPSPAGNALVRVYDRNFTIMLRSADALAYIGRQLPEEMRAPVQGLNEGFYVTTDLDGVRRLNATVSIPGVGWHVVAGVAEHEAYADYYRTLWRSLAVGAGVLLLVLLLAWRIGGAIVRPIGALAGAVAAVGAGDIAARAPLDGPPEIKAVAGEFNRMLDLRDRSDEDLRRFRFAMDSTSDGIYLTDRASLRYVDVNAAACAAMGVTHGVLMALGPAATLGVSEKELASLYDAVIASQGNWPPVELLRPRPNGGQAWVEFRRHARRFGGGWLMLTVARDISARKRAEALGTVAAQRLEIALEGSQISVWEADLRSGEVWLDAGWARNLGQPAAEIRISLAALQEISHPEDRQRVAAAMVQTMKGREEGQSVDHRVRAANGEWRWMQSRGRTIERDAQGRALRMSGTNTDITARKRAEAALEQSNNRFRDLVESTDGIVWEADAVSFEFQSVSKNAERLLGYRVEEWLTPGFWAGHIYPPDRDQAVQYCTACTSRLESHTFEYRFVAKDGRLVWLHDIVKVVEEEGRPRWLRGLMVDVTERRVAEAARASLETQLRESQKMQAIGTLAGGIAHDFNNILAAILGNTALAIEDSSANAPALQSLEEIRKAGVRGRDLVQQILAFSRREPTRRNPIALAPVVAESARLLRASLPARLVLGVHCDDALPAALADATQIEQVIINLAANAMQAMRSGPGHIDLRLDTVLLDAALARTHAGLGAMYAAHPGRTLRLCVRDDGPGMDAATLARIFEPFFTTKPVDEGTGLGLSVVMGIVQSHEGAIVVESTPGRGASFTLYLPVAAAPAPAQDGQDQSAVVAAQAAMTATASAAGAAHARHILYVDDDEGLVLLVGRLLKRRGYRFSGHVDQQEALAALRADPEAFDLVLTDYNMPGMSGLDVARAVHAIRADLPVAVASGFIDETLHAEAGGAGVCELIFKATDVAEFCAAVQRLAQTVAKK